MSHKTYYRVVSVIFAVIAIAHAFRLAYGWEANIGGVDIPVWVSWFALVIAGYLAVRGWNFASSRSRKAKK